MQIHELPQIILDLQQRVAELEALLEARPSETKGPRMVKLSKAAEMYPVSADTIRRAILSDQLPGYRKGPRSRWMVKPAEVETWIKKEEINFS